MQNEGRFRPYGSPASPMTGEGRIKRHVNVCPRCGEPVPVKTTGRPAKWCSQRCRRAAYEERRAAKRGAIAVEVVEHVKYVEHDLDQCLAEVLTSPLMCRRAVYRWRQMLRDGELHREGWRELIAPLFGLAAAIEWRARGDGRETVDLPHDHGRPRRTSEITFTRDQFSREIRWLISKADLREFLRALSAALTQMERYYEVRRMKVPINQLVVAADAVHWARGQ